MMIERETMRIYISLACCVLFAAQVVMAAPSIQGKNAKQSASASTKQMLDPQQQVGDVDKVVAVINDDVITLYELDQRVNLVAAQLSKKNIPLPPLAVLERQLLERMIMEKLQIQFASESGIRVDDTQLNLAINRIAEQNGFSSTASFRAKLEADGVGYQAFREEVRKEIIFTRVREREVDSKIIISDSEVDNYLANKARQGSAGEEFHLAHILIVVPEQASAENIQAARDRAEHALKELKAGADFAQVAAGYSDADDALKGGELGWRKSDRIPPLFMNELQTLEPGKVTSVLRSPSGFHILKLVEKRSGAEESVVITQTHARHILIKTSELISESDPKQRLMEIKNRIDAGADFAEQAKRFSQDGSAQSGGDLDWISPGQTVPDFEEAMNKLHLMEIGMVQTQFGWHLIQVVARRDADISEQQKRQQARVAIGTFKSEEQYQEWLRQLRDRAFVEYRLEENK